MCRFLFSDSEPPDIGNWFSSYVYESPESDTCSILRDEVSEEKKFDFEVVNGQPKGCVEHNSSFNKNTKVNAKAALIQGSQYPGKYHIFTQRNYIRLWFLICETEWKYANKHLCSIALRVFHYIN